MAQLAFFVQAEFEAVRDTRGRLRDLKGRFAKTNRAILYSYQFQAREFLESAADELRNIPSAARYRQWHDGKNSTSPSKRRDLSLANAVTSPLNIIVQQDGQSKSAGRINVGVLSARYMNVVAPHWAAIEFGSTVNKRNAYGALLRFYEPGKSGLQVPGSSRVGRGRLFQGRAVQTFEQRGARVTRTLQPVSNPIRPGNYLGRAYDNVIRRDLQAKVIRRLQRLYVTGDVGQQFPVLRA